MRGVMTISAASAIIGYVVAYFAFFSGPAPRPEPEQPVETQTGEPVVLAHVVDVTDLDPLLDPAPAPAQPTGVPFDSTEPLEPVARIDVVTPGIVPAPIPPAAD